MRRQAGPISTFLFGAMLELSCQNKHRNFNPPPPPQPQMTTAPAPAELPQPPDVPTDPGQPATIPAQAPEVPPPPAPASPQPRSRRAAPSDTRTPPVETGPATQPAEPPRLGAMTTPEQERELNAQIDQSLNNADASLRSVQNRSLNREQERELAQVRSFIRQARERRAADLPGARSLAQRAEILASDLAASTR